jgi:hypothetical protein
VATVLATVTTHTVVPLGICVWSVGIRRFAMAWLVAVPVGAAVLAGGYVGLVTDAVSVDLNIGR